MEWDRIPGILELTREDFDQLLFEAMVAMYRFERSKVSCFELDYTTIYLLQFLRRRSSARMKEVAREMDIPVSTATRLVDRLQARGLVSRRRDTHDKRNILVSLEPAGERIVRRVEDHTHAIVTRNLGRFNAVETEAFVRTAAGLKHLLRVPAAGDPDEGALEEKADPPPDEG